MLEFLSPEVFQAIVDRLETGVYAVDLEQKISYWNYGAGKITGFLSQNVLGRPCSDNIVVQHDEHNPLVCAHHCPLEGTRDGAHQEVVTYVRHRSGHVVPVRLWTMALKDRLGNIVGAVKVFAEKTAIAEGDRAEGSSGASEDLDMESGVPSRASIEACLHKQLQVCATQGRPCGIICVCIENLDGFRQAHGIEAGTALVRRNRSHPEGSGAAQRCSGSMVRGSFFGRAAGLRDRALTESCPAHGIGRKQCGDSMVGGSFIAASVGTGHAGGERRHHGSHRGTIKRIK